MPEATPETKKRIGFRLDELNKLIPPRFKNARIMVQTANGPKLSRSYKLSEDDKGQIVILFDAEALSMTYRAD